MLLAAARGLVAEYTRRGPGYLWRDAVRVTAPTLVIYGSHDRLVRPAMAALAARSFRGAQAVVLPRLGSRGDDGASRPGGGQMRECFAAGEPGHPAHSAHGAATRGHNRDPRHRQHQVLVTAPRVIPAAAGTGILEPGYVTMSAGVITGVAQGPPPRPPDIELGTGMLVPGLVDLQVNGYFGSRVRARGRGRLGSGRAAATGDRHHGFSAHFHYAPLGELAAALRAAAKIVPALRAGARVLGVHAEGPFIAPSRKGAHNGAWIIPPTPAAVDELIEAGHGVLRLVTLAPERDGAPAAITRLTQAGIMVSVGHSDATGRQVALAADLGARMVTHLFNAQRPLHHREPGVVGQALTDFRLTSGLITDLRHVSAEVCVMALRAAPGRIAAVTDAAACAGMPPGRYLLGGEPIELPPGDGVPPVREDGTLAGSALRMDTAVANLVTAGIGAAEAVAAATRIPADLIGRPDLGRIAPGAAADLAWLDDGMRTVATWIGGELVYSQPGNGALAPAGGGPT